MVAAAELCIVCICTFFFKKKKTRALMQKYISHALLLTTMVFSRGFAALRVDESM
jgi:hypothetical protein